ncbi:juvenile hormone esterase-like [Oratosquilla oratoria]|uniref:juvenile hormone esterase-like n=1 Tax=Oratosquilla oratoria TaxID=337810 RepID=UPI003F75BE9D
MDLTVFLETLLLFLFAGQGHTYSPPLDVPQDWRINEFSPKKADFAIPKINYGLQDIVTEEHWERFTIGTKKSPKLTLPSFGENAEIVGKNMVTIKNKPIYAFKGIRYGQNTSEYRFKPTRPAGKYWDKEPLEATAMGHKCPQTAMIGGGASGSEDCLFLNVFTPTLDVSKKLPVMFFIHGGAFISGDTSIYLPTKLLDHPVILVTIHYRLGTLGFFSLQNDDAPGNAALHDQITALEWVYEHIEDFGGDKEKITIFGESAGSVSVSYLLLLERSRDIIAGVIGESGSALEHWALDLDPIFAAEFVGDANGCEDVEDHKALYDCMMGLDAGNIALVMSSVVGADRKNGGMGFMGAAPVVQDNTTISNPEDILVTKFPEHYIRDGEIADVPVMYGANKHEGSYVLAIMYQSYLEANGLLHNETFMKDEMLTKFLNAFGVKDQTHGVANALHRFFIPEGDLSDFEEVAPGMVDMAGVFFLKAGAWETVKKLTAKDRKAYFYSFDYESDDSMFRWLFMGSHFPFSPGVTHSDEMMYIFSLPAELEGEQILIKDRMVKLWTNFATYGNPTPKDDPEWKELGIPEWPPYSFDKRSYILMQSQYTIEEDYELRWTVSQDKSEKPGIKQADYDSVVKEKTDMMIVMIVFVVATCFLGLGLAIFYFKKR